MRATEKLAGAVGFVAACLATMIPRASFYRRRNPRLGPPRRRATPLRALSSENRKEVLDVLHSDEFVDKSPVEVLLRCTPRGRARCASGGRAAASHRAPRRGESASRIVSVRA